MNLHPRKILIISGATATGKTSLALKLAKKYGGEIINFDSLLFYREMEIGTAKPTLEERQEVPHHFIDIANITSPLNAHHYAEQVRSFLEKNPRPFYLLVGGSGFYLQALQYGSFDDTGTPAHIIKKSQKLYEEKGITPFLHLLKESDPLSFKILHSNDHYRIRRAVEYWWSNQRPLSQAKELFYRQREDFLRRPPLQTQHLHLKIPQEQHLEIIAQRTEEMLSQGLVKEVAKLLQKYPPQSKPLQSIGYKECQEFLQAQYDEKTLKERIIIATRRLAKAQKTWFNSQKGLEVFNPLAEGNKLTTFVQQFIEGATHG